MEPDAAPQRDGVQVVMATDDGFTTAKIVATKLGIDEVDACREAGDSLQLQVDNALHAPSTR